MYLQTNSTAGHLDTSYAYGTQYALRHRLSKQPFVEENGKNICTKEICNIPEINGWTFIADLQFESYKLQIARYKASNFSKIIQDLPKLFFSCEYMESR